MSAYIKSSMNSGEFILPYSDDKNEARLKVWFDVKGNIFLTGSLNDNTRMMIDVSDVDWLRQTLDDIKSIIELREENKIENQKP